jgi:predicted dehydrogenase
VSEQPLAVAVLGLGAMGRHHARIAASLPGLKLVATCDPDLARAREHAHGGALAVATAAELPASLDVAVIAAPTTRHRELAEPLLLRGVSCLVEKPLAATLDEADALIEAARRGGAQLAVGHAERFNPVMAQVRDRIREPRFVEAHRLGTFPDRSLDVDVVLDLMIHDLDLLLWLSGADMLEVQAAGIDVLTPRVDIASARLLLSSGCTANLTASRVSAEPVRKLRVFQEDAYVSVDLRARSAEMSFVVRGAGRPEIRVERIDPPEEPGPEPLRLEQEAFMRAVRGGSGEPGASGLEGRRALAAALAVLEAMRQHAVRVAALRGAARA